MLIDFDTEELGKAILIEICTGGVKKGDTIGSDVIWDTLHETLADFEYTVFDEALEQLEKQGIMVELW